MGTLFFAALVAVLAYQLGKAERNSKVSLEVGINIMFEEGKRYPLAATIKDKAGKVTGLDNGVLTWAVDNGTIVQDAVDSTKAVLTAPAAGMVPTVTATLTFGDGRDPIVEVKVFDTVVEVPPGPPAAIEITAGDALPDEPAA